jgi:hypothetical protein
LLLERLLYELGLLGVSDVWLESRSATPDRRDLKLVDSARTKSKCARKRESWVPSSGGGPSFTSPQAAPGELN